MREYNQNGLEMMMKAAQPLRTIQCSIRRQEASKVLIKAAKVVAMKKMEKAPLTTLVVVMSDAARLTRLSGGSI